ncbi:MAG: IS607 family transposase [Candidatus Korarchaeum sp.]
MLMSERLYTIKEAKKLLGVTTWTIQQWDRQGKIRCVRTVGGRRRVPESEIKRILGLREERIIVGYARVLSSTQKDDLERQKQLISSYAKERGYGEIQILTDVGSGLNEKRKNFLKLLDMILERRVSKVIIAYEDRLTRFGFDTLRKIFSSLGTEVEVINRKEPREELIEDLITIVSRFAGKLYGLRSHKYKEVVEYVKKAVS